MSRNTIRGESSPAARTASNPLAHSPSTRTPGISARYWRRIEARRLLVVDDENADLRAGLACRAHAGISAGTEITTRYRSESRFAAKNASWP